MSLDFTAQELRSFFQENGEQKVGIPCSEYHNPIAVYFRKKRTTTVRVISDDSITDYYAEKSQPLKPWQKDFAKAIDDRLEMRISGNLATAILDEIMRNYEENALGGNTP